MTYEDFSKRRWRHSEIIRFNRPNKIENYTDCLLLVIDFEQGLFKLEPINKGIYEDATFWARVEYCEIPPKFNLIKK